MADIVAGDDRCMGETNSRCYLGIHDCFSVMDMEDDWAYRRICLNPIAELAYDELRAFGYSISNIEPIIWPDYSTKLALSIAVTVTLMGLF